MPENSFSTRIKIEREPSPLQAKVDNTTVAFSLPTRAGAAQYDSPYRHDSHTQTTSLRTQLAQRYSHQVHSSRTLTPSERRAKKLYQRAQVALLRGDAKAAVLSTKAANLHAEAKATKLHAKAEAAKLRAKAAELELSAMEEDTDEEEETQQEMKEGQEEQEEYQEEEKEEWAPEA